ncbi:hypothetical protein AHAS_Ahas08G0089100 [Arachis hypogaea]
MASYYLFIGIQLHKRYLFLILDNKIYGGRLYFNCVFSVLDNDHENLTLHV